MPDAAVGRPFWLVWTEAGRNPQYRHDSEPSALREAQRLAREHPGQKFVVMQSVASYVAIDLQTENLRPAAESGIPF